MVAARRLTVCMVATACLSLTANLWVRNQRATAAAVRQEQRWSALSERLDLAALSTPILASPPPPPSPAAGPSPPASSPALSSAAPQSDGGQPRKDSAAAARLALASERAAAAKRAAAKRAAIGRAAAKRAAAERAAATRPAFAPGQAAATHDLALRSSRGANATLAEVDTEDGVRHGSRCRDESDKRTHMRPRCPDASDIVAELDAEAAGEAAAGQAAARAPVSPVTSPRSPVTIAARASVRACASLCGPVLGVPLRGGLACNHSPLRACRRVRCASSPP